MRLCKFGFHKMKEIHLGFISCEEKKNKPLVYFKGIWQVKECEDCGQQEAEQQKEKEIGIHKEMFI